MHFGRGLITAILKDAAWHLAEPLQEGRTKQSLKR